jgi:hypothetical protein
MWVESDHIAWPRGEVFGLGLTNEGIGLLRGEDCDILAQQDCVIS